MTHDKKLRLAVLVSGSGTNLQALLDRSLSGSLEGEIVVVASDRPDAYGLERARNVGVPAHVVDYRVHLRRFRGVHEGEMPVDLEELDRKQRILLDPDSSRRLDRLGRLVRAEQELVNLLALYQPDYVCLAGYMRLVTPFFVEHYNQGGQYRILNIHPALLPAFPGQHGYEDTFAYGCKWGGVTVHFVDEGEDTGPIIAQAVYPIWPGEHLEEVRQRGLQLEYEIYTQCLNWLARGQVQISRGADEGKRILITDPSYAGILRHWVEMAFS